eukprot:1823104-Pyramimonas_sp.AAC.1
MSSRARCAIHVVPPTRHHVCDAVNVVQYRLCNPCSETDVALSMVCKLCCAICCAKTRKATDAVQHARRSAGGVFAL